MDQSTQIGSEGELIAQLRQLYGDLFAVIERDPEQEILGIALPVVDCIMTAAREALTSCASVTGLTISLVDLISPATVEAGAPIRALDTWIVVGQILAALTTKEGSLSPTTPTTESTTGSAPARFG